MKTSFVATQLVKTEGIQGFQIGNQKKWKTSAWQQRSIACSKLEKKSNLVDLHYTSIRNISNLIEMLSDSEQCHMILEHLFAADSNLVKTASKNLTWWILTLCVHTGVPSSKSLGLLNL